MSDALISLNTTYAYKELGVEQQLTQTLLLTLKAQEAPPRLRPALHLMLCIDTSGSMMGRPLELVVESVKVLLQHMTEKDTLGLVTFANKGRLLSEPRSITPEGRAFFEGALLSLQGIGSTNLGEGLKLALQHIPQPKPGKLSHIVVLSDGKPNRGTVETKALRKLVEERRGQATLSFFGYGSEHDEDLLQSLAQAGRSRYTYVESPEEAPWVFTRELGKLFSCLAQDLCLRLTPEKGATFHKVHGGLPFQQMGRSVYLDFPNIVTNEEFHVLVDVQLSTPDKLGAYRFGEAELSYFPMDGQKESQRRVVPLVIDITSEPPLCKAAAVKTRLLLIEVATAWRSSRRLTDQRQYEEATELLQPFLARLHSDPTFDDEHSEVREWYEMLVDEIEVFSREVDRQRYNRLRKTMKSEMDDPTGVLRRNHTSFVDLTTTQRGMLNKLMQNVFGLPHAHLVVQEVPDGERAMKLGDKIPILGETSMGRRGDVRLEHSSVSRRHVRLVATPEGYLLMPLASAARTRWNGIEINRPTLLKAGDWFSIGQFMFEFQLGLALPSPPSSG